VHGVGGVLREVKSGADPAGDTSSAVRSPLRQLEEGDDGEGMNKWSPRSSQRSGRCAAPG
jgi:hypothetical protein